MSSQSAETAQPSERRFRWSLALPIALSAGLLVYAALIVRTGDIPQQLTRLDVGDLLTLLLLLLLNLLVVSLRLHVFLRRLGYHVALSTSLRAAVAGFAAGLVIFQAAGVLIGRVTILRRTGISEAVIGFITLCEKILLLLISGGLCLLGAYLLFGSALLLQIGHQIDLVPILLACLSAASLSVLIFGGTFEITIIRKAISPRALRLLSEVTLITLIGHGFNLTAFVVILMALGVHAEPVQLLAAAAIVSFAASIPISINGWGIREVASIKVFGVLGVAPELALTASIAIGLLSTLVVLASAVAASWIRESSTTGSDETGAPPAAPLALDALQLMAHGLGFAVAILIFFQLHIPLNSGMVNVNTADPLAIFALVLFLLVHLLRRHPPRWILPSFNYWLLAMLVALVLAFTHGVMQFGLTNWAFANRLLGWLVIMGYGAVGAFVVMTAGRTGERRLVQTLLATASITVLVEMVWRYLIAFGVLSDTRPSNFEAFTGNRNAFAFMLLMTICAGLVHGRFLRPVQHRIWLILLALAWLGLWLTQSRAGYLTAVIAVIVMGFMRLVALRQLALSLLLAVVGALLMLAVPRILHDLLGLGNLPIGAMPLVLPASDLNSSLQERWTSILRGGEMFLEHPLIGSGLGAFIHQHQMESGNLLVIHNTSIWLLAEFGLVGAAPFIGGFAAMLRLTQPFMFTWRPPATRLLLLLLLAFAAFSLVHEILYQRIFWLLLGMSLATHTQIRDIKASSSVPPQGP